MPRNQVIPGPGFPQPRAGLAALARLAGPGLALALALCLSPVAASAENEGTEPAKDVRTSSTFTITEENDFFAGTDNNYTNGTKLHWQSADIGLYARDHWLPALLVRSFKVLPFLDRPGMQYNLALALCQTIYTPRNTSVSFYQPDDRPYAGWSSVALALHAKTPTLLDTFELNVGIVGPSSLAENAQNTTHDILGIHQARGWAHQLQDEPTLQLGWQRTLRLYRRDFTGGLGFDVLPHVGATAGNALIYANAGLEMRFGLALPWDFGTSLIRVGGGVSAPAAQDDPRVGKPAKPGVHVFVGADGRAIARNLFLDGNTWRESHSIPKNNFVADVMAGVGAVVGPVKITYTHTLRTQEFRQQKNPQLFGSVSLSVTF